MRRRTMILLDELKRCSVIRFGLVCLLTTTGFVVAHEAPPSAPPASTDPPEQKQDEKNEDSPPSLDDLLGLDKDKQDDGAEETADREMKEELERELTEKQIADAFKQAVEKMKLSAELLDVKFDTGLGTQRVQEDIISKLQQLIDQAKKQNKNGSSSSSSQQQQQSQEQQQNPGKNQQQKKSQADAKNQGGSQESQGEAEPPPLQEGELNTILEETRSEWGSLPDRIRNMLMQGRQEKYSSLYDRLTSEYYKKLAEENPR
ncbi:MAG: hypothetical protein O7G85_02125 [Planctomycetota bacterium]|nr:hypothetical protein [Planctomycetota bacterium]